LPQAVGSVRGAAHVDQDGVGPHPAGCGEQARAVSHHGRCRMGSARHHCDALLKINDHDSRVPRLEYEFASLNPFTVRGSHTTGMPSLLRRALLPPER
jgi:hypothetical protein